MKHMKKIASLLLALTMVFAMAVTANAATISVDGAKNGETYTAYKIFDVTMDSTQTHYAYTIAANSQWKSVIEGYKVNGKAVFTLTPSASDANVLVVTYEGEIDGAALAAYLDTNKTGKTATKTVVAANNTASFTDLEAGYYFVDTTLGSLCSLFTTNDKAKLEEKNTIPTIDKQQSDDALQIGEDVTFTITVTDSKGTDAAITVHDTMSEGLTLKTDSFEIKVDDTAVDKANYEIKTTGLTDNCTFEIVFTADFVKSLAENKQIVITYDATLNDKAKISPEGNKNLTWLNYSEQETEKKETELFSFKFDVDKVDGSDKALAGAKFKLYDAETGGNVIKVVATETAGVYRVAATTETGIEEMSTDTNGQLTVLGLDKKTYYLEETVAPAGYNKLTERQAVNLSNGNVLRGETDGNKTYGVKIVNQSGTELPSTGGIGTTIFYVLGSILVIGAAVLLVTKKRMGAAE